MVASTTSITNTATNPFTSTPHLLIDPADSQTIHPMFARLHLGLFHAISPTALPSRGPSNKRCGILIGATRTFTHKMTTMRVWPVGEANRSQQRNDARGQMVGVTFEVAITYFRDLQIDREVSVLLLSLQQRCQRRIRATIALAYHQ